MKTIQNLPSESGHIIENAAGSELTQREKLQFSGYLTSTDDSTNDVTIISDAPTEIDYDDWLELTEQEKEGVHWLILNAPSTVDTGESPESMGIGIGVCNTAAATAAKTATLTDYVLTQNGVVAVRFVNDVPANATLNINGEGAIPIYYKNAAVTADVIPAGTTATFVFDGNVYQTISLDEEGGTDVEFTAELTSGTKIGEISVDGVSTDIYAPTPEAQVNADWNASSGVAEILNKPTLGTASALDVATTGDASNSQVVKGNDTRLTDARPASDVSAWAKESTKPTYTASEVGLDKVGNFKAVSTEANQGLSATEQGNARANIGAGTSDFDGQYSSLTGTPTLGSAAAMNVATTGDAANNEVVKGDDTRLSDARPASDVPNWAKAETKPTYTATEVGAIPTSDIGVSGGVASLDSTGKIPTTQLPSAIDEIIEGYLYNGIFYEDSAHTTPITGEVSKIYVDLSTNKTYRWSGSQYVEISASLALGETSSTAYRGDYGKAAYDHSQITTGNPHNVTASDVGLGNVGNFKAVSTVENQGLTNTEKVNARTNIGAGTSNFDGQYTSLTGTPTLGTAAEKNVAATGNASSSEVVMGNDTRLSDARPASDVAAWAKADDKPTYTASEVGLGNVGNFKAVSTVANQGLTSGEQSAARDNIGLGNIGNYKAVSTEANQGLTDEEKTNSRNNIGLGSSATRNVPATGDATSAQVVLGSDSRLTDARNAADVYDWAKASTKPTYTASEVGLGNVGNFKAVSTVANQGLSDIEKENARDNIGAGTSNFDGAYSSLSGKPTLGTAAALDVAASGDASTTEVVKGNDSRLTDARNAADVYSWAKAATKPEYTAAEVGAIASTDKGANNGVATLDNTGKIPTSQLPSAIDEIIEAYYYEGEFFEDPEHTLDIIGETGKIYVDLVSNKTYRWSGSRYVEISESLALGENESTAYRGDRGKTAYDHSQLTSGNPHNVTAAEVGLGNVGNFKAVSTEASQGLTDTEKTNARTNIGAGTSNFDGQYSSLTGTPTLGTAAALDVATTGDASTTQVVKGDDTRLTDARNAADVYSWAKAETKPTYTASEVGLGNVGNFKAVSTVANQGLTDVEKEAARANIGAGTSTFDGDYDNLTNKPTLGTASALNVAVTGDAAVGEVVKGDDTRLSDARNAADVYSWAKAETKPTYTASEVGLGNVGNFKAVSTVANQGLDSTEQSNARANIGAGTSNFDGAYSSLTGTPTLGSAAALDVATTGDAGTTQVVKGDDTRLTDSRNAADVYSWAKAETKPTYTASEVGLGNVGNFKAVSTVANQGLTSTEQSNARANIGLEHASDFKAVSTEANQGLTSTEQSNARDNIGLGTAAVKDVPTSGNATTTQVVMGNDTRLSDARNAADVYDWAKAANKPAYTAAEVGAIPATDKGAASGVASLDSNGKVPSSQLPSYVDDIIEGYYYNNKFYEDSAHTTEITGETGKIYVDLTTDKTYRFSGTGFVEISESLALGETSSTAFRGDYGKAAYDHSLVTSGNPHNVTASDVGLGNVGNFKAVSTVANQGLTSEEQAAARANIGAGSSSFSGSYNDLTDKPTLGTASALNVAASGDASTSEVVKGDDTRLSDARNAADVYSWAKAETKPTYTASEVGLSNVGNFKAVSTEASQGLTSTEQDNARTNIGLGTAATKSVAASGDAGTTEVVMGNDSRLTDARNAADVYDWAKAATKPTYTASDVGLGNVGNFKAVSTVANQGLSDAEKEAARANIGAGDSSLTIGTTSTTAAAGNHTHSTSISNSAETPSISLAANTTYELDAGGQSYFFKTPADSDTHRPIKVDGTEILGDNTTALDLVGGDNITVSNNGGVVTISAGGAGHDIIDADDTTLTKRSGLKFDGYLVTTDDSTNDETVVSDAPTEITWDDWNALTTAQKEGTKWLITNVPGHIEPDAIFILRNQALTFSNLEATISDARINANTYPLVYWSNASYEEAESCKIVSNTGSGTITFTAETAPTNTLVCDIVFISAATGSGGGSGSSGVKHILRLPTTGYTEETVTIWGESKTVQTITLNTDKDGYTLSGFAADMLADYPINAGGTLTDFKKIYAVEIGNLSVTFYLTAVPEATVDVLIKEA